MAKFSVLQKSKNDVLTQPHHYFVIIYSVFHLFKLFLEQSGTKNYKTTIHVNFERNVYALGEKTTLTVFVDAPFSLLWARGWGGGDIFNQWGGIQIGFEFVLSSQETLRIICSYSFLPKWRMLGMSELSQVWN